MSWFDNKTLKYDHDPKDIKSEVLFDKIVKIVGI